MFKHRPGLSGKGILLLLIIIPIATVIKVPAWINVCKKYSLKALVIVAGIDFHQEVNISSKLEILGS